MTIMKKRTIFSVLAFFLFFLASCGSQSADRGLVTDPYEQTEFMMGTVVNLKIFNEGKEDVLELAFDRLRELEAAIDEPDVEMGIEEVNSQAGIAPVEVSDDMYDLLKEAYLYSERSEGSFDFTIGPLTELWGIGSEDARLPEQEEIDAALELVDYRLVEFDDEAQTVYLPIEGMRFDLGAIAKGYMTDEMVTLFEDNSINTAIIDLGGNIFVMGNSSREAGADWNVGVQDPFEVRGSIVGSLPASSKSIVTSGIYERYVEVDGVQYHHLLNPETGYPFDNEIAGVSIISNLSIDGDGLSTLVFSEGLEKGLEYVNQLEAVEAVIVTKDREIYLSDGLVEDFKLTNEDFTLIER